MKIIKRILLGLILLVGIGIVTLYFYKDTLIKRFVENYNKNYNITIAYNDTDLNLFKKFPNASVAINDLNIVNDISKDTLFAAKKVFIAMNIEDLFKKADEKIVIKDLEIDNSTLNLIINKDGDASYNVKRTNSNVSSDSSSNENEKNQTNDSFIIDVKKYKLINADILFNDKQSNLIIDIDGLNHTGKGDFSASKLDLDTDTKIDELSVGFDNIYYFNKAKIELDAILGIDLDNMKFTFKENKAKINDLSLKFDGFIAVNDTNQEYDITFNAPNANFKSVLSLIPNAYSKDFSGVSANGIANVNGLFKGILSDNKFPKYHVKIQTENASFKYPDLPKTVTNINFDGTISSTVNNDIALNIKALKFTIDKDTFETKGNITKLTTNPTVDASFKGTLDLENLKKAYPIALDQQLKGILKADITTQADQLAIDNNQFDKIKTNGTASLERFTYAGKDIANPIHIKNAAIKFNTNSILLSNFTAKTGSSDLNATGNLDNLFAFLFNDKKLQGNFNVTSDNFVVSDFLIDEKTTQTTTNNKDKSTTNTTNEALKIPAFLDITTNFKAKNVVYDNLNLKNVTGTVKLKNQKAKLINTKAKMLDGDIILNGDIDTKTTPAVFDLDMNIDKFDIANSFNTLETFQKIVPVAKALRGKYNTTFKLKGNLDDELSPNLNSLSGNAFAQLLVNKIDNKAIPLLNSLSSSLNFIDFNKIDFSKLKAALSFNNGTVTVKPFDLKYKDMTMKISGSHGFDQSLKYSLKMDIPAKYLGTEAVNLLSKLTNINKDTITVPLSTVINGTILKPTVKVNFKQALTHLAVKVIEYQKQELTNQATEQVTDAVNEILENNGIKIDSTTTNTINDILESTGIKTDSTSNASDELINQGVKEIFNIFGNKKKKK